MLYVNILQKSQISPFRHTEGVKQVITPCKRSAARGMDV